MFFGADTHALQQVSRSAGAAADELDALLRAVNTGLEGISWSGPDGDQFRQRVSVNITRMLQATTQALRGVEHGLIRHAEEQDLASGSLDGSAGRFAGLQPQDIDELRDRIERLSPEDRYDAYRELLPDLTSDQQRQLMGDDWAEVREFGAFDGTAGPRSFGAGLLDSLDSGESLRDGDVGGPARDEIEIKRLDNGKYIIVLPGVIDLTSGANHGLDGAKGDALKGYLLGGVPGAAIAGGNSFYNDAKGVWDDTNSVDSPRDMYYAQMSEGGSSNGSQTGANAYAFAVKEAMRAAGVPPGADVMLVGHSFGAYTALELASDPTFNDAMGHNNGGPYHVNVTHVMGAGANAGFRLDDLPSGTRALLLNNEADAAVALERAVPANNDAHSSSHHAIVNFRDIPTSGGEGAGHDPGVYSNQLRHNGNSDLQSFLHSAGSDYNTGGDMMRVTVHDAYR